MPTLSTSITVGGRPAIIADPRVIQGTKAWKKANSIFCPLGPAPSQAWMLMLKRDLDQLDREASLSIVWTSNGDVHSSASKTFRGWYVKSSERLFKGGEGDANALHLVEFVDARGIAAKMTDTGSVIVNRRSWAQNDPYLTGTQDGTWITLGTSLWSACGLLGAWPGLPYAPHGVPENFSFIGMNAWESLCAFLDRLDCAVAHDPIAGTYTIVALGAVQAVADPTLPIWNGEPDGGPAIEVPATVRVYFNAHYEAYGQERDTEIDDNWAYNGAGAFINVVTGAAGAVAGTVKSLWDDLAARLDEDGNDANAADRAARAAERSAKWVQRMQTGYAHKRFDGIHNISCGGQVRALLWRNWGDGTETEYISKPDLILGFAPGADAEACFLSSPASEHFQPPDLARHTYPNYPRLPNIVQVFGSPGEEGEVVGANDDGFHFGSVRRWVNNGLATLEECWIRFVDEEDGDVFAIAGDNYGPARLSGISTSDGQTLPVYTVRRGSLNYAGFTFTLLTDMAAGSATATVNDWWGVDPGDTETVIDPGGLFKRSLTGANGIAFYNPHSHTWYVVECQSKAGWLWVTLLANMAGTPKLASSQVDGYKGTQQDIQSPGSTIDVYGIPDISDALVTDDKVLAFYSSEDDRYYALPKAGAGGTIVWGRTQAAWKKNGGDACVSVKLVASRTSTTVSGAAFDVYLPRANDGDPNVVADKNIAIMYDADSVPVCVSDYMDDKIGTFKAWLINSTPPTGWAWMDGTANATGNGGTGIDARKRFIRNVNTMGQVLDLGGDDDNGSAAGSHNHFIGCLNAIFDPTDALAFTGMTSDIKFYAWKINENNTYDANGDDEQFAGTTDTSPAYTADEDPMYMRVIYIERLDNSSA